METQSKSRKPCTAIVLAAGQGKRMGGGTRKQYMQILDKPVLFYSLMAFQRADFIDDIILVSGEDDIAYCRNKIVDFYGIQKVSTIVPGGKERYDSVHNGLNEVKNDGYVFIHDGARPFLDQDTLKRGYASVRDCQACVIGMPVKDTMKIADDRDYAMQTPNRNLVWMIQTPQIFSTTLIRGAYSMLMREPYIKVTDDAMVVEQMLGHPVKLIRGSYENIKITTPEDMEIAEVFAERLKREGKI